MKRKGQSGTVWIKDRRKEHSDNMKKYWERTEKIAKLMYEVYSWSRSKNSVIYIIEVI